MHSIKIPTTRSRDIKILYGLVLSYMDRDYVNCGICSAIIMIHDMGWLSKIEKDRLKSDFMSRKPVGKNASDYWFSSKDERINFIKTLIISL